MILYAFAIRDRATDSFGNPVFALSSGQAIRSFSDEINRNSADNPYFAHPDDYDLFALGQFDTDTGRFAAGDPEQVAIGKNLKLNGK